MNVAARGRGPGSEIPGSVRHKIPIGGSGFAGTYRDSAFNGYEYGNPVATSEDFKAMEPRICKTLTEHRLNAAIAERQVEDGKKSDLMRLLESASAPDLTTVKLQFDWQDEFQQKDFLIPPNRTGYKPLWRYSFGKPTVDLRAVGEKPAIYPKLMDNWKLRETNDPYWMGPTIDKINARRRAGAPVDRTEREAATREVVNLPPL